MKHTLILKLEQHDSLSDTEKNALESAVSHIRDVAADVDIVSEGDQPHESSVLLEGWAARYKILAEGKRQITSFHIAGDFVDLSSFLSSRSDQSIVALTPCRLAVIPHDRLRAITEMHPHLTRLLWMSTLIDGANHREWLVAMGRRSALGHLAHLLCELFMRLQAIGRVNAFRFNLPLTQVELADALGLSPVHMNRTIQELRGSSVVAWRGEDISILDWDRLCSIGEFDPSYLELERIPR
jgi:CRP-like cAMP-binding protein